MRPPRIYRRAVEKLTRYAITEGYGAAQTKRTLYFTFPGGRRSRRSTVTFVAPENVPAFEGDTAWFEMELVEGKPSSFWRAVRQVEEPESAR